MADRVDVEIAKLIGVPINPNLKVPVALSEIANLETAEPGDVVRIFNYTDEDANADDIYDIGDSSLTKHAVTPVEPATLAFHGLKSNLEYVLIDEVLPEADQDALGRKKAGISNAMDKKELKRVLDAILTFDGSGSPALPDCEVDGVSTGRDLYDVIMALKHKVEDYATDYVLLCGSAVMEAIDTYDKDNADNFQYRVGLKETLVSLGIKPIKIIGAVNGAALLDTKTAIFVGRNSTLAAGKPVTFVRRLISPAIAAQMGVDGGERIVSVAQVPTVINAGGENLLGYACFGYESMIETITNYRAIAFSVVLP
jgi:hypothetical protein